MTKVSSSIRKGIVPLAALAAGIVIAPVAAYAATGSFSSSTTTSALKASNTGGGFALDATGSKATAIRSTSQGTTNGSAMFLRQFSTGTGSNALYGKNYVTTGTHYGVQGVSSSLGAGVFGQGAKDTGVLGEGEAGVVGVGTSFGVVSAGDGLVTGGNMYDDGGVSGVCNVASGDTSASCAFQLPFLDTSVTPIVIVTPQGNPGGAYWVSGATASGFTLNLASPAPTAVDFGYQVIGHLTPGAATQAKPRTATAPAQRTQR